MILGIILGPMAEGEFRRAVMLSQGRISFFYSSPISVILLLLILLSLIGPLARKKRL